MGKFVFDLRRLITPAFLGILASVSLATLASAAEDIAPEPLVMTQASADMTLEDFLWTARVIVVFADSPNDPRFIEQLELINARPEALAERDVVVITDTDPGALTPIRKALRPRGFDMVLIGKDGQKYLRKPFAWDVRELSRSIDKMPLRQQEMRDRR